MNWINGAINKWVNRNREQENRPVVRVEHRPQDRSNECHSIFISQPSLHHFSIMIDYALSPDVSIEPPRQYSSLISFITLTLHFTVCHLIDHHHHHENATLSNTIIISSIRHHRHAWCLSWEKRATRMSISLSMPLRHATIAFLLITAWATIAWSVTDWHNTDYVHAFAYLIEYHVCGRLYHVHDVNIINVAARSILTMLTTRHHDENEWVLRATPLISSFPMPFHHHFGRLVLRHWWWIIIADASKDIWFAVRCLMPTTYHCLSTNEWVSMRPHLLAGFFHHFIITFVRIISLQALTACLASLICRHWFRQYRRILFRWSMIALLSSSSSARFLPSYFHETITVTDTQSSSLPIDVSSSMAISIAMTISI